MVKIHQYAIMCAPTMSQFAAIEALKNGDDNVEMMRAEYNRRRVFICEGLRKIGLPTMMPEGAFYIYPYIGGFGLTSGTPMPLPSESIILGVGAVQKVPVWSDEVECFLPVEQAQIVASFDHRVVDGGDIGRLMLRIAHYLEHPEFL